MALGEKQRTRYAVQAILNTIKKKDEKKPLDWRLARELIAVIQGTSEAIKKREEIHKFAMVNRYATFSFW